MRNVQDQPEVSADYLSEVLGSIKIGGHALLSEELRAPWGVSVPESPKVAVFYVVDQGSCVLSVFDGHEDIQLSEGDLVLLTQGSRHVLRDHRTTPQGPARKLLTCDTRAETCAIAPILSGGGAPSRLIVGEFELLNSTALQLFSPLPHIILLNAGQAASSTRLGAAIRLLCASTNVREPGYGLVSERIADLIFVEILRAFILRPNPDLEQCPRRMGILTALLDPQIGRVVGSLIQQPSLAWTVESMATEAGLSRTAFAVRFTKLAGVPPLQYLTKRRMELATELLEETDDSIESIAWKVGYDSTQSLTKAFSRETGSTPGQVRKLASSRRLPQGHF